jgi:hypothetical protein
MSQEELRLVCSLVNNDYSTDFGESLPAIEVDLYKAVDLYKKYKSTEDYLLGGNFYSWIIDKEKTRKSLGTLLQNYEMFSLPLLQDEEYCTAQLECNYSKLKQILAEDGFVFLDGETP